MSQDDATPPPQMPLATGTAIDRYVLLDVVGQGAAGTVYAAYDPQLNRRVALKLLHAGLAKAEHASKRMLQEARALARLSHPNVVAVHDVGTHGAQVYIAMEFVDGRTLRAFVAAQRPGWPQTLRLLDEAGRGLAAAHRAGLIHRDFKPENVLVGRDGRARVTDFGLARSMDDEAPAQSHPPATAPGGVTVEHLGTPEYMSPEQRAGHRLDARSDQYSFCVTAFELLFGVRPDALGPGAATHPDKSPIPAHVRAALARGLSANAADRFPSMEALLDSLRVVERQSRWRAVALTAAVAVALVGGLWWARRVPECPEARLQLAAVWDGPVKEALQKAFAATSRPDAEEIARATAAALDAYSSKWATMLHDNCVATQVQQTQPEADWLLRERCLARRRSELGATVEALLHADAAPLDQATKIVTQLTPIDVCADLGLLAGLQRVPEAPAQRTAVEAVRQRMLGLEARLRLLSEVKPEEATALSQEADDTHFEPLQAEARYLEGQVLMNHHQWEPAKDVLFEALVKAQQTDSRLLAVQALRSLVDVEFRRAAFPLAHQWADLAKAMLASRSKQEPLLEAELLLAEGDVLRSESKWPEARATAQRALERAIAADGNEGEAVATAHALLSATAFEQGETERAVTDLEQSIAIRTTLYGARHTRVQLQVINLAIIYKRLGRFDKAIELIKGALAVLDKGYQTQSATGYGWMQLGSVYATMGDPAQAVVALRKAIAIARTLPSPQPLDLANMINNCGGALMEEKKYAEAEQAFTEARTLIASIFPEGDIRLVVMEGNFGDLALVRGQFEAARAAYQRVEAKYREMKAPNHPNHTTAMLVLGHIEMEMGHPVEALKWLEQVQARNAEKPLRPAMQAQLHWNLARAAWATSHDRAHAVEELAGYDRAVAQMKGPLPEWAERVKPWRAKQKL